MTLDFQEPPSKLEIVCTTTQLYVSDYVAKPCNAILIVCLIDCSEGVCSPACPSCLLQRNLSALGRRLSSVRPPPVFPVSVQDPKQSEEQVNDSLAPEMSETRKSGRCHGDLKTYLTWLQVGQVGCRMHWPLASRPIRWLSFLIVQNCLI